MATNPNPSTTTSSPTPQRPLSILFICLGNICRSPMAHAVFQHHLSLLPAPLRAKFFATIDSAGTGAYHARSPPDSRTLDTLARHGIGGFTHSARKVRADDFERFDLLLGMDGDNVVDLRSLARRTGGVGTDGGRVELFGRYAAVDSAGGIGGGDDGGEDEGEEVIDPYYGGKEGFEIVFEQVDRFSRGLLRHVLGDEYVETEPLVKVKGGDGGKRSTRRAAEGR